jgi:hypothetical protein
MAADISLNEIGALSAGLAALFATIGGFLGGWIAAREYRLKSNAYRVERDVDLFPLLSQLMKTAHARGTPILPESTAAAITQHQLEAGATASQISEALSNAVVTYPIGEATQAAAISIIGSLGVEHPTLREAAFHALQALEYVDNREHLKRARPAALQAVEAAR